MIFLISGFLHGTVAPVCFSSLLPSFLPPGNNLEKARKRNKMGKEVNNIALADPTIAVSFGYFLCLLLVGLGDQSPDVHCLGRVLVYPNIYNAGGE